MGNQLETPTYLSCGCGVPSHLHGTACGWGSASVILFPRNEQEKEWKDLWQQAHPNFHLPTGEELTITTP